MSTDDDVLVVNGLPLEYEGFYRAARRDLDVADLINNPEANGVCRVLHFFPGEQFFRSWQLDSGPLADH